MASPTPPQQSKHGVRAPPPATESDDILTQIFLLLDSPADLLRASAASPTFRRIITDPRFLSRFRALHPPPLLGVLTRPHASHPQHVFLPAEPPQPSAAAARAFADFNYSFLPSPGPWKYLDSRDGRDLLYADSQESGAYLDEALAWRLAVCDPLHRRYRVLPPIPIAIAAFVGSSHLISQYTHFLAPQAEYGDQEEGATLLDHPHDEEEDGDDDHSDSSSSPPFRVMFLLQCTTKMVLFVFSSSGSSGGGRGKWRVVMFHGWRALCGGVLDRVLLSLSCRSYVHGRFCWHLEDKILLLDARRTTPEFSTVSLPSYVSNHPRAYVEFVEAGGEEQRLGVFTIHRHAEDGVYHYHLRYAVLQDGEWEFRWEPQPTISLPVRYCNYEFVGVAGGQLLLEGTVESRWYGSCTPRPDRAFFSLDLRTMQLEWFCESKHGFFEKPRPYVGFPLCLSPPMV